MASSTDRNAAIREVGRLLTRTEASDLAAALEDGEGLSSALTLLPSLRRTEVEPAIRATGLAQDLTMVAALLRGIEGARSDLGRIEPLWTMPGHVAQTGPLTTRIPILIERARTSVVCSTFNFQSSSALWQSLHDAAQRPGVHVRVYLDTAATRPRGSWTPPTPAEIAAQLAPGVVLRTRKFHDQLVRNHAKFLAIDHRFLLVTSANFSASAETRNVEFGVQIDNPNLTETVERELLGAEGLLYRQVDG